MKKASDDYLLLEGLIKKKKENHNELISWDSLFTVPQFDFRFFIRLPRPYKECLIIERNELGQIIKSKVPSFLSYN